MTPTSSQPPAGKPVSRERYLEIVRTAAAFREFHFARQAATIWLAAYPGDLPFRLFYAEILVKEGHAELALPILEELTQADPEYLAAVEMKLKIERTLQSFQDHQEINQNRASNRQILSDVIDHLQWIVALRGAFSTNQKGIQVGQHPTGWGEVIYEVRKTLGEVLAQPGNQSSRLDEAEQKLAPVLAAKPDQDIVAVTHLELLRTKTLAGEAPLEALNSLAEHYHKNFPANLTCTLVLVERLLDGSQPEKAVSLLHLCASKDVTGQTARRLWGPDHPYQNLWPARLEKNLDLPIPASVAAYFGWNQLPVGISNSATQDSIESTLEAEFLGSEIPTTVEPDTRAPGFPEEQIIDIQPEVEANVNPVEEVQAAALEEAASKTIDPDPEVNPSIRNHSKAEAAPPPEQATPAKPTERPIPENLRDVQVELERLGSRLHLPDLINSDGRFPVYVILTTRHGLEKTFGNELAGQIEKEILRLVDAVRASTKWNAILFYADEGKLLPSNQVVSKPVKYDDAWALKLALVDLDTALGKRGEMIGAVLIAGGSEIVPFHHLPNPVDDTDEDVPSDNPYGTRDENYFIPEWPVGRMPSAEGDKGDSFIKTIRNVAAAHGTQTEPASNPFAWWKNLFNFVRYILPKSSKNGYSLKSFGYTAAAWRLASFAVFRPIGDPRSMLISPAIRSSAKSKAYPVPGKKFWQRSYQKGMAKAEVKNQASYAPEVIIPAVTLGYFNLHGLADAPEWYGQSDPLEPGFEGGDVPDYPVALRPQDIGGYGQHSPLVVFSEACYGANTIGKTIDQAIAFRLLEWGTLAFAGSTCVSYGAINMPLTAADYLGNTFWNGIQQGLPVGESLKRAKISLAREMHKRQGYLDGEDQKTLISFVLYGDPLTRPFSAKLQAKGIIRAQKPLRVPNTVCDHSMEYTDSQKLNQETLRQVKKVVERYLPGMKNARFSLRNEKVVCHQKCHLCAMKETLKTKGNPEGIDPVDIVKQKARQSRRVVILSKQKETKSQKHFHYARLTLDEKGRVVKLVVSR
jgi:hypothetical protein